MFIAEGEVADARLLITSDPLTASRRLRDALAMWTGPAFGDFAFDDFAQVERARLNELRIGAIEDRIDADLACGKAGELVSELETLRDEHPLRERLIAQHSLALYRTGRPADALRAIGRFRRHVGEELGIDPSPLIVRLEGEGECASFGVGDVVGGAGNLTRPCDHVLGVGAGPVCRIASDS